MPENIVIKKCPRCGYSPSAKGRSNPQNRYYWSVVIGALVDHTGFTPEEMHEVLKYKFLGVFKDMPTKDGKTVETWVVRSTTNLDTKEMEEYLSWVRAYASSELGVYIPEPNEVLSE